MKIIEAKDVFALPMKDCIAAMREAILNLKNGVSSQPLRTMTKLPDGNVFGFMPAYLGPEDFFGAKIATAFFTNHGTAYPSHMGYVMLMESAHGQPVAMVDATSVTQLRTGAVSGLATDLLANKDAKTLAIIGAGAQGKSHLEAMLCVRPIEKVRVFDVNQERCADFCAQMAKQFGVDVQPAPSVHEAAYGAEIVCTVTTCKTPILSLSDVAPGAHVNAVGAYSAATREIASDLVAASRLYADDMTAILNEGGEYLLCKADGLIDESHILGDLGMLLVSECPARQSREEITLFSAHGLAVEDVACAKAVYQRSL